MSTQWYVRSRDAVHGPFDSVTMRKFVAGGKIVRETPVAQSSQGPWYRASQIRGLLSESTGHQPPTKPSAQSTPSPSDDSPDLPVITRVTPRAASPRSTLWTSLIEPAIPWLIAVPFFFAVGRALDDWHRNAKQGSHRPSEESSAKPKPGKGVAVTETLIERVAAGSAPRMAQATIDEWQRMDLQARLRGRGNSVPPLQMTVEKRACELMTTELKNRLQIHQESDGTIRQSLLEIAVREASVAASLKLFAEFSHPL